MELEKKASKMTYMTGFMTGFNDSTVHDFSMYYPKGQLCFFENILNTNSKPKIKKRRHSTAERQTDTRNMEIRGQGQGLGVLVLCGRSGSGSGR